MDTATKPEQANATARPSHDYDRSKEKLQSDLKLVVTDLEVLIKEVAAASNEGFATLRVRFEKKLVEAQARLLQAKIAAGEQSRHAADAAHAYVTQNPWRSAGILAAAGAAAGFLLGRRATGPDQDASTK
jgi:ElaB/YqjD/DUF883 family membrane-anchored ribosome-binding protein